VVTGDHCLRGETIIGNFSYRNKQDNLLWRSGAANNNDLPCIGTKMAEAGRYLLAAGLDISDT
jgi:hypothetical protein